MQDGIKVVSISNGEAPAIPEEVLIEREQIAAQIVAVMQARFEPTGAAGDERDSAMR